LWADAHGSSAGIGYQHRRDESSGMQAWPQRLRTAREQRGRIDVSRTRAGVA
jgi:hypothetical protein